MEERHLRVIVILESKFPIRHRSRGKGTLFKESFLNGTKKHTIRSASERWEHNIKKVAEGKFVLSVCEWAGTPHRSKEVEIKELSTASVQRITMTYDPNTQTITGAEIDDKPFSDIGELAKNEGMTLADFTDWFFGQGMTRTLFEGCIIHFDPKTCYRG